MPNNRYRRGSNFERELLTKLIERGYDGLRSAGSHSAIDLIVWEDLGIIDQLLNTQAKVLKVYAIQCKSSKEEKFNLSSLIWEDSVRELTGLSDNLTKVLCIKQYRKITTLVWMGQDYGWFEDDLFGLNNLRRKVK